LCAAVFLTALALLDGLPRALSQQASEGKTAIAGKTDIKSAPRAASSGGVEALNFPPGSILVICDDSNGELRSLDPKAIVLTPEAYQRLLEQSEQQKTAKNPGKIDPPSVCRITGRVESNIARLRASFEFVTDRPGAIINLGCQRGWAIAATLDGQLPAVDVGDEGFLLHVPTAGSHKASLELVVPVSSRHHGNDRGFDLDLPRAAISVVDSLTFPGKLHQVQMGARELRLQDSASETSKLDNAPIVPIDHLDLAWKGSNADSPTVPPILTSKAQVRVRIADALIITEADLVLQPLGGRVSDWKLRAPIPSGTEVDIKADDPRVARTETAEAQGHALWTIRLKEPSADSLEVHLRFRQPRTGSLLSVGPFLVSGGQIQIGSVEVRAGDDVRPRYLPSAELVRGEVTDEQRRNNVRAVFSYSNLPVSREAKDVPAPLLQLRLEPLRGAAEARAVHTLRLVESESRWQVTTRIEIKPIRTHIDRIGITLPAEFQYDKAVGVKPADLVDDLVIDAKAHTAQFKLAQKVDKPFILTFEGSYALATDQRSIGLELPRPRYCAFERTAALKPVEPVTVVQFAVLDRGGQISVSLPEGLELLADRFRRVTPLPGSLPPILQTLRPRSGGWEYTWQTDRLPEHVDLGWRPRALEVTADSVVDVTVRERDVLVHQAMALHFLAGPPMQIELRVPESTHARIRIVSGGGLSIKSVTDQPTWVVNLPRNGGRDQTLAFEYTLDREPAQERPESDTTGEPVGSRLTIAVVQPLGIAQTSVKARVWSDLPLEASLLGEGWSELAPEVVRDHQHLPIRIASSTTDSALALLLVDSPAAPSLATTVVERVLADVAIGEDGYQTYTVRYLISQVSARWLDLDLPAPLTGSNLDVRFDGRSVPAQIMDSNGREVSMGRMARVYVEQMPTLKAHVLTVRYQCDLARMAGNGLIRRTVSPATMHNTFLRGRARWQIHLQEPGLPLLAGNSANVEQSWSWRNGLFRPRPAVDAGEVERWFAGHEVDTETVGRDAELLCWQTELARVSFWQMPERLWLLLCSVIFLVSALFLFFMPLGRFVFGLGLATAGAAVVAVGILTPGLLPPLVYGCEPALAIVALLGLVQATMQVHYRWRVKFMPGFARLKSGSSLVRPAEPAREPSTVDHLPKRGSSVSSELRA
jgi:hypothetical protein